MANVISVNALNIYVKSLLESDEFLQDIALQGEISGFVHHRKSGHFYFQLKDEQATVKAIMFRSAALQLGFLPENGMHVVVRCKASLYEKDGTFQIYVEHLFPDGIGSAQIAYEQLKKKLQQEGMFDSDKKREIPSFPKQIGLITSENGAALQDIITVSQKRYPLVKYLLYPVRVQGIEAEKEIELALLELGKRTDLDCILVTRGGGSKEDLWVFNSETIARAVVKSTIPVISAVGHEIDFTILDFVADMRAATPSAAVELILPDKISILEQLSATFSLTEYILEEKIANGQTQLNFLTKQAQYLFSVGIGHRKAQNLQYLSEDISNAVSRKLDLLKQKILIGEQLVHQFDPEYIFQRGFSVVMKNGAQQVDAKNLSRGDEIELRLKSDMLVCEIKDIRQGEFKL